MIIYLLWKDTISDIKNDIYITGSFGYFLFMVLLTPILLVIDIVGIPIELLYLVYKKIGENKDE